MKTCVIQPMMYPHCWNKITAIIVNALVQYPWLFATLANVAPTVMSKPAGTRTKTLNRKLIKKPAPVLMMIKKVSIFPPSAGPLANQAPSLQLLVPIVMANQQCGQSKIAATQEGPMCTCFSAREGYAAEDDRFFDAKQKGLGGA
jgi:hypothetical protein